MSGDLDAIVDDAAGADARVAAAADERRRLREARSRNAEQTSLRDVLVGAAESGATVTVVVGSGRTHRVRLVAIGADVVVATPVGAGKDEDRTLLLGLGAVRTVIVHRADAGVGTAGWVAPAESGPVTDGQVQGLHMGDILAERAEDRPRITSWVGADQMSGTLTTVGLDVAVITTEGSGESAYVRLDSTTEISVSVSSSL